ncbi:ATP-binding cassette subfamily C protein CydC [Desulfobotulus alkaliphilus]|uniref:ATP-binding cassette subfamily C protein CydC n=1 Tax=Desulfobotulus alkaliphilus TaxID=622671 RepID=A0A562RYF0_9BACT|nr:thiol reductant ABC exporter subunit CydC [Desulfobotulus alkaliphilus]TWI74111.1 ATP-binding cassette subfamily C protein CydC [Desulfobotulus alkaliphilus]
MEKPEKKKNQVHQHGNFFRKRPLTLPGLFFLQGATGFAGLGLGVLGLGAAVLLLAVSGWFITAAGVAALSLATLHSFNYLQPAALIRLLAITRTLALYGERIVSHDGVLRLLQHLRTGLFDGLSGISRFSMAGFGSGELMQRMLADLDRLDQWTLRGLSPWVWATGLSAVFLAVLLWLDSVLAVIFLLFILAVWGFLPLFILQPLLRCTRFHTRKEGKRRQFLLETLAGLITLRTTGAFTARRKALEAMDQEIHRNQWRMQGLGLLGQIFILLALSAALWMVVFHGGRAVEAGHFSAAVLVGIACVMLGLSEVFLPLSATFQALGFTREARDRITASVADGRERRGGVTLLPEKLCLCLENVSARQKNAATGPQGVSLTLHRGDSLWIEGPSGCGKSTLAAVMAGWLPPEQGEVRVNGTAMADVEESCLRRHVGLLDQDVHLFPMTLGENLRLARPLAGDDTLMDLLDDVALGDWARELPEGLDTVIGDYGTGVSGGQARRLALARLLLMETPVLILDEPFEGLDADTADALLVLLRRRQQEGILIVISHQHLKGNFTHCLRLSGGCF